MRSPDLRRAGTRFADSGVALCRQRTADVAQRPCDSRRSLGTGSKFTTCEPLQRSGTVAARVRAAARKRGGARPVEVVSQFAKGSHLGAVDRGLRPAALLSREEDQLLARHRLTPAHASARSDHPRTTTGATALPPTFPVTRATQIQHRDLIHFSCPTAPPIAPATERSGIGVLSAEFVSGQHVDRLTVVHRPCPHPSRERRRRSGAWARSRCQRRLWLGYAPSRCEHQSPHLDRASSLGRRKGFA